MYSAHLAGFRLLAALLPILVVAACADDPAPPGLLAAPGSGGGPKVNSTDPSVGEQGRRLNVRVTGSGFNSSAVASWERNGAADPKIAVNSTGFVSSKELLADITIAADATLALYDVAVEVLLADGGRKKGVGIEKFEVVSQQAVQCIIGFDLTMVETNLVRSDGLGTYFNKQQKVVAFTGSGDGFRFDTNGSQQVETAGDPRHVRFDFAGTGAELDASFLSGVDFRFTSGLNLCTQPVGTSASVTVGINFISRQYPGRTGRLQYGGRHPPEGDDCGARGVSPATLTRVATDTWSVASGPSACLYYFGSAPGFDRVVPMPLGFTITAQGPVP